MTLRGSTPGDLRRFCLTAVPLLAVVRQSGKAFVFVVIEKEGQLVVERRPVELSELHGGGYRVDGGLNPGDRIAVSSLQSLRDGAPVAIQPGKT